MAIKIRAWRKLRDRIASEPLSYDQSTYMGSWTGRQGEGPSCGTVACLAGEAIIANAGSVRDGIRDLRSAHFGRKVADQAAAILGVAQKDSGIFGVTSTFWPEPARSQWRRARSVKGKAAAALAYIDWVIEHRRVR